MHEFRKSKLGPTWCLITSLCATQLPELPRSQLVLEKGVKVKMDNVFENDPTLFIHSINFLLYMLRWLAKLQGGSNCRSVGKAPRWE
jgi:hypothetical protein